MALTFAPTCLPLPRYGAPTGGADGSSARPATARALAQRGTRDSTLALSAAGFPGLTLDQDRAFVGRAAAERGIDRIGMSYLRAERGAGAPPSEHVAALLEQLRQVEQGRPRAVKVELLGPVSLALQLIDEQEHPLAYDPALREALAQHVMLRSAWVRDQIEATGASALVVFDEPFLDALGSPFCPLDWDEGSEILARALADLPGPCGICVAGEPRWAVLLDLPADVIFFDAYEHSAGLVQAADAVVAFLARGGALGWGLVPADAAALAHEPAAALAQRFASSVEYLAAAGATPPAQIAARALISTGGGLAHLPAPQAAQVAALCAETAAAARAMFGLDT